MDRRATPAGRFAQPNWWSDNDDGAESDISSVALRTSNGCIEGLVPNLALSVLTPGEAWWEGQRIRVRTAVPLDIAGQARPPSGQVAWLSVAASYAVERVGEVVDDDGVTQAERTLDGATVALLRGANAANQAAAVRPPIPDGSIILCDILLDHDTAVGSLGGSDLRRPKCPHDALADRLAGLEAWRRTLQAVPNTPAAPALTSTSPFQVTSTWTNPGVQSGGGVITGYWHQWRRRGAQWQSENIVVLGTGLTHTFGVPDASTDIESRVAGVNANGPGEWSPAGRIAAADIMRDPPLQAQRYETAGAHSLTWGYRETGRMRLTIRGAQGGGGSDGTAGVAGADATSERGWTAAFFNVGGGGTGGGPLDQCFRTAGEAEAFGRNYAQRLGIQYGRLGNTRCDFWVNGDAGASGADGADGSAGAASSVTVATRSISQSAAGGEGGDGGDAGVGGAGGVGANGQGQAAPGFGAAGGPTRGAAGSLGALRTVIVTGLRHGDVISIVVGAGGAGSPVGAVGSVLIEPLPAE